MAWISCGNERKAKYQKQVYDIEVIPDKHNCGYHGTLRPFYEVWTRFSSEKSGLIYVLDSDVHTVENCEFVNVSLYFHVKTYTSNFVFRNCLFDGSYNSNCSFNVQVSGVESDIDIYFYNCTFERSYNAVNSITTRRVKLHFINCKSILPRGDHFKVVDGYEFKNCYTIGGANIDSAHSDGYQFLKGKGFIVENYRSEMIPLNTVEIKQLCNSCAYTDFQEGSDLTTDFVYLRNAILNGGGTTLVFGSSNGHTLENVHVQNSVCGCAYRYNKDAIPERFADTVDNVLANKAFVSSVWKENGVVHFLASNYTNQSRTIIAVDEDGIQNSFILDACPRYSEYNSQPEVYITQEDFPFDIEFTINKNVEYLVFYDTTVSEENQIRFVDSFENVQPWTWQLKTTSGKKYIIIGTDDDNMGNTKFFRLLRTYGFPYTMNVESENMDVEYSSGTRGPKMLGDDVDTTIFTDADAPSLFPNNTNVVELGQYLKAHNLGEVAQHGGSGKTLWDSTNLTGSFLDELYATYTTAGGTKTEEELKTAIMEAKADTDVAQGAPYVMSARAVLQSYYGFMVDSVGIWGGSPTVTIDNITLNLNPIKGWSGYPWRANGYKAASTVLGNGVHNNTTPYNISRDTADTIAENISWINQIPYGHVHEFFWHAPFTDVGNTGLREFFDAITTLINEGKVEVVTRSQYEAMGEYVQNPVTRITATRAEITLGESDSKSEYHVTATYADGTTADVSAEAVVWNDKVNTSVIGTYSVPITYRGANVTIQVVVTDGSTTSVDLHLTYKGHINDNTGEYSDSTYDSSFASNELIRYDSTRTYFVTFSGTSTDSNSKPNMQGMYCYASDESYLGKITLSGIAGKCTDVALPDATLTYPTTAYIRIQGSLNKSYITSQVNDWSCHADTKTQKTLTSITATKTVTTYNVGDTLSTSDIVTTAHYDDSTTATVNGTYDTSGVDMSVVGTYSIGVSYTENGVTETTTITITVSSTPKTLTSITATKTTTTYSVGDTLSTSDIVVTAHYSDSTMADVTSSANIDVSQVDMATEGSYPINISYTEDGITKTSTITIIVVSASNPYTILSSKVFKGTKYVATDIVGNTLYNYEAKVQMQSSNKPQDLGGHLLSTTNTYYPFLRYRSSSDSTILVKVKGTESGGGEGMPAFNWDTDYILTGTIDGANYTTKCTDILPNGLDTVIGSTTNSVKYTLFAYGGAPTTAKYRFRGIFYYMILRDTNNVELYHFVPAIRNADNVEGILDTVSNTFYTFA